MSDLIIGWAETRDIPGVIDVLCEIADFRASLGQDRWRKAEFTPEKVGGWIARGELVVARLRGKVIGTMLIEETDPVFWPDRPDGEALYVHKLTRSRAATEVKGLASAFMAFAEGHTRNAGLHLLRLDCAQDEKLCSIYEGLGFTRQDLWEVNPNLISWRWEKAV